MESDNKSADSETQVTPTTNGEASKGNMLENSPYLKGGKLSLIGDIPKGYEDDETGHQVQVQIGTQGNLIQGGPVDFSYMQVYDPIAILQTRSDDEFDEEWQDDEEEEEDVRLELIKAQKSEPNLHLMKDVNLYLRDLRTSEPAHDQTVLQRKSRDK